MELTISIPAWSAFAPGITTREQWHQWSASPFVPGGSDEAPARDIPALLRRRLNPLGRAVAQVACDIHPEGGVPVLFASRYGDAQRALDLLHGHAVAGEMSPTEFTLSVHNAIGAIHGIARGDTANYTSIATGAAVAEAALVEAAGLLADGHPEVLVVCYDAPLPVAYRPFQDEPAALWAWAWRVCPPTPGLPTLSLHLGGYGSGSSSDGTDSAARALPLGLEVMRFFLRGEAALAHTRTGQHWQWSRGA